MERRGVVIRILCVSIIFLFVTSAYASEIKKVQPKSAPEIQKTQPVVPERPVKRPEKVLPDLVVERVWLDAQSQINFQIKNAGKGEIPDSEHNQGVVKVDYGRGQENFYFSRASSTGKSPVDPKGVLKKPGGSVQYDTKIKVEVPVPVTVVVDEERRIAESNENNNRSAATTLTPPTLSLPKEVKVPLPERKPTVDKEAKVAKTVTPAVKKPGAPVLTKVVDGIDIIFPAEGVVLTPGQRFGLRIKSVWETKQYIGSIALYRIREDESNETVVEQRPDGVALEPGNTMIIEQQIPESAQEGVYIYRISTTGFYHNWSDRFGVRPAGSRASVQVVTPGGGGEHWKTGSTHAIRWHYRNVGSADPPERWTMTLNRVRGIGSGSDYTKTLEKGVERQWLGDKWEYTYQWHIPQNFTHGDYRISISVEEGKGKRKGIGIKGEGSLAFTIGSGDWHLKVNRIFTDPVSGNLMAEVKNGPPAVSGRVDFRVSHYSGPYPHEGGAGRELQRWDIMRTLSGAETEIVDLGKLGPLAEPPNPTFDSHCGMVFRVTDDSTNRIDEKYEGSSTWDRVYYRGQIGKVYISVPHNGTISTPNFSIEVVDCGTPEARGSYTVWQIGDWPSGRRLSAEHHENKIYQVFLYPEDSRLASSAPRVFFAGRYHHLNFSTADGLERVNSTIEIRFFEDLALWAPHNPYRFQIRLP